MASWTPTVRVIVNGQDVDASVTNGPIADLTNRTDWLKAQLDELVAGGQLVLRAQAVTASIPPGTPVYFNTDTNTYTPALAAVDSEDLNRADPRSYWQGLAFNVAGSVGSIILGGPLELTTLEWAAVFEDGVFATGDIFLSATTPGKISTSPGTLGVYLGNLRSDGTFLVRQGATGAFLDHVHYERTLVGSPAGTVVDPSFGSAQTISSPDAGQQGWLPANATYFPGWVVGVQIPTGAVFGYNLQHADEASLREIFPVIPANNAQFSQGGVILSEDLVVTNQYGIWWMDNSYGSAPWPVDYAANGLSTDIVLWTTRIIASADLVSMIETEVFNDLRAGEINTIAVAKLFTDDQDSLGITATNGDNTDGYQGEVTLTNNGVRALRGGRGLGVSGSLGNTTDGWRGLVDAEVDIELPATHIWTEQLAVADKVVLLTTNGAPTGTVIGARGHRLGAASTDFIDFVIDAGSDLDAGADYQITAVVTCAVNTASGSIVAKDVNMAFYRFGAGSAISTTNLQRTATFSVNQGVPGTLQVIEIGPFSDVVIQQNQVALVRILPNTSGTPLPGDQLRVVSVRYRLTKVA